MAVLLEEHALVIERICRRLCRDEGSYEDLIQDTYVAILASLDQFRGEAAFSTWVYTVARTQHIRALRRRAIRPGPAGPTSSPVDDDVEAAVAGHEIGDVLRVVLDALPPRNRAIVWLRHVEGFSTHEVARSLGLSDAAVKSRLRRSLMIARAMLVSLYEELDRGLHPTWDGRWDA